MGVIQIRVKKGWLYANDKNWDLNREDMLCQYLGFKRNKEESTSNTYLRYISNILSGDLICYAKTSCCVHLKLVQHNANNLIPYVACKYIYRLENTLHCKTLSHIFKKK